MTADRQKNPEVLVIEDEQFFRQVIADTLKSGGYQTVESSSATDVARLLGRHEIGVVLTDLEMPDISGLEVLKVVKELQPDVSVVVISAHQDFYAAREVLSGGALEYLVKPFSDAELLSVVRRGIDQYRSNLEAKKNRYEAERLLADLVLLREVGETASGQVDLQSLLDRIVELIVSSVDVQVASLMLPGKDGNLRIRAARGLPDGVRESAVIKPGEGISGHVYTTGEPVLLNDINDDDRFSPSGDKGQYSTSSALSLPLKGRDRTIGVLNVNNKVDGSPFSAHDQNLFASIAHQATLAIENFSLFDQLRKKARELEALSNARSKLVCNLSHELKTPLTSVLGFADLLKSHRAMIGEAEQDDYLQKIADASLQMEKLISGMLLLFSIDSGTARWSAEPVSVAEICNAEIDHYREQIEKLQLNLEVEIDDDLPLLEVDRDKFRLLVSALIDNAIKFNELGGWLYVKAAAEQDGGTDQVYIRIHNDGTHVPIEAAEEIFAQYSQLGEVNTAKPEGIGIGLALCRVIVEKMGGRIFLEDTKGTGTSFGLLLPARSVLEDDRDEQE